MCTPTEQPVRIIVRRQHTCNGSTHTPTHVPACMHPKQARMHAYIGVLANRASIVSCVVASMSKKHRSARAWGCTRVGIICGSPGVLLCKTVKDSVLCQVCRALSSASDRVAAGSGILLCARGGQPGTCAVVGACSRPHVLPGCVAG